MGHYEKEFWLSDTWGSRSGAYRVYVPDMISDAQFALTEEAVAAASRADADVMRMNMSASRTAAMEPLARLLLRSEAIASSRIEGLEAPVAKLMECEALEELGIPRRADTPEAAVLSNIAIMEDAVATMASEGVSAQRLCELNGRLLQGSAVEGQGGRLREVQNWIGGSSSSPLNASYVPPRPEYVPAYMEDLERFCAQSPLPPVAVAAIAHAQFETIHPFVDGNGRVGRALIHAILKNRGLASQTVPPVSLVLSCDRSGYAEALSAYRGEGGVSSWVTYFSEAMSLACERALALSDALDGVERAWREVVRPRAGSAADDLLGQLVGNPVISVKKAVELTGKSYPAALAAVRALEEAGVLEMRGKNRKSGLYVAGDVVAAFTAYERSLAARSGDTLHERPGRPVPQRASAREGVLTYEELRKRIAGK